MCVVVGSLSSRAEGDIPGALTQKSAFARRKRGSQPLRLPNTPRIPVCLDLDRPLAMDVFNVVAV